MTTDNLQTVREAVSGGDSFLVLVVPATRMRDLFGDSAPAQPSYTADLTVPQYREQFEPDMSDSRIRELCAAQAFPDTTCEEGQVVPGAYKDSTGSWRITREGIQARQRMERQAGLRKRAEAEEKLVTAEAEAQKRAVSLSEARKVKEPARRRPGAVATAVRPNRGSWERHVAKEAGS